MRTVNSKVALLCFLFFFLVTIISGIKQQPNKMTKDEARVALEQGKKVTHRFFSPDEYCYIKDGEIMTEDGYKCGWFTDEFWTSRDSANWQTDWSIYNN